MKYKWNVLLYLTNMPTSRWSLHHLHNHPLQEQPRKCHTCCEILRSKLVCQCRQELIIPDFLRGALAYIAPRKVNYLVGCVVKRRTSDRRSRHCRKSDLLFSVGPQAGTGPVRPRTLFAYTPCHPSCSTTQFIAKVLLQ